MKRIKNKAVSERINGMHDVYFIGGLNIKRTVLSFVLMPIHSDLLARFSCGGDVLHWCIFFLEKIHSCQYADCMCSTWDYIVEYQHWPCIDKSTTHTCSDVVLCMIWICYISVFLYFWQKRLSAIDWTLSWGLATIS